MVWAALTPPHCTYTHTHTQSCDNCSTYLIKTHLNESTDYSTQYQRVHKRKLFSNSYEKMVLDQKKVIFLDPIKKKQGQETPPHTPPSQTCCFKLTVKFYEETFSNNTSGKYTFFPAPRPAFLSWHNVTSMFFTQSMSFRSLCVTIKHNNSRCRTPHPTRLCSNVVVKSKKREFE